MFKKIMLGAALLISVSAFAQTQSKLPAEKAIERLNLAAQLVDYGYETESSLPLIQAVQIYQELNLHPAIDGKKPVVEESDEAPEGEVEERHPARTQEQLLADATEFADGDQVLLALIGKCQKTTRRPTLGLFYHEDCINAKGTHYWDVTLNGGESSFVYLNGDGSSDLDIYLYDQNGSEIDRNTSAGDKCSFIIHANDANDKFDMNIKIVNRGHVENSYTLIVN